MNVSEALTEGREILRPVNPEEASLISEILLTEAVKTDRLGLFTQPEAVLNDRQKTAFRSFLRRVTHGEPAAYITGRKEFYRLEFNVNQSVLIPRPETELLVEKALELIPTAGIKKIADVGTGSGAIAVSLAVNMPGVHIYATDISAGALAIAEVNARKHNVAERITFLRGDLLNPLPESVDLLIANLPYVRRADITGSLRYEPPLALDGGIDGLDCFIALATQLGSMIKIARFILLEAGAGQAGTVQKILRGPFPAAKSAIYCDLAGIERMVSLDLSVQDHRTCR